MPSHFTHLVGYARVLRRVHPGPPPEQDGDDPVGVGGGGEALVGAVVKVLGVKVNIREVRPVEVEVERDGRVHRLALHVADLGERQRPLCIGKYFKKKEIASTLKKSLCPSPLMSLSRW